MTASQGLESRPDQRPKVGLRIPRCTCTERGVIPEVKGARTEKAELGMHAVTNMFADSETKSCLPTSWNPPKKAKTDAMRVLAGSRAGEPVDVTQASTHHRQDIFHDCFAVDENTQTRLNTPHHSIRSRSQVTGEDDQNCFANVQSTRCASILIS